MNLWTGFIKCSTLNTNVTVNMVAAGLVFLIVLLRRFKSMGDMASNTPFPQYKTMGDDKHDVEVYIEDLIDYCIMQNWFDPSK